MARESVCRFTDSPATPLLVTVRLLGKMQHYATWQAPGCDMFAYELDLVVRSAVAFRVGCRSSYVIGQIAQRASCNCLELEQGDVYPMPRRHVNEELAFGLQGISSDSDDNNDEAEYPDEEVFALQGVSDSDDDAEHPYDAQGSDGMQVDSDSDAELTASTSTRKKPSRTARGSKKSKSSSRKDASDSESEEEEETWGRSKGAYYSSNAAQLDSEDEEANELEEQEALRLQAKAREGMCDEDFGLGDVVEGDVEQPEVMYACCPVVHAAAKERHLGNRRNCRTLPQ